MIPAGIIEQIVEMYQKHGWNLRRVLLSASERSVLGERLGTQFAGVTVEGSDLNAAWFSRRSKPGSEAWELRHFSETPFALLAVIADCEDEQKRREILQEIEERMRENLGKR